jgi:hypothetical protein
VNRQARLKWAHEHLHWTTAQWQSVLWSDESPFVLRYQGKSRIWQLPNERYQSWVTKATVKYSKKIMVWGCFAAHGVGCLHRINGILDRHGYHKILQKQMLPSARDLFPSSPYLFQQDKDPKHTAKPNKNYLQRKQVTVMEWPAQSPDLNPIENLWALLDKSVSGRRPKTEDELFQILVEAWHNLDTSLLQALVESMPRRCQAVIENNGYPTKY